MNKYIIFIIGVCCCCLASCIKDEALNKECDIESAWIEGAEYEDYFYQTTEMRKEAISSAETDIVFSVRSLLSLSTQIPLHFKITDGATIEPANGSVQDFTKGPVVYTVTSEDGEWKRTYNVIFQETPLPAQKFSFELVETQTEQTMLGGTNEMHVFYEQTAAGPNYCWATGNSGSALTKNGSKPEEFPVYSTPDGKEGRGVCLNTQSAGVLGEWMKKPIAAGSLFLGKFQVDYVLSDALKATRFGVANSKEPVRITGWYKYKPGAKFTDMNMKEYPDREDEASIYAVYYRLPTTMARATPLTVMTWKTSTRCWTTRKCIRWHAWLRCRLPTRGRSGRCSSRVATCPTTWLLPRAATWRWCSRRASVAPSSRVPSAARSMWTR